MISARVIPPELAAALKSLDRFVPGASRRAASSLEIILARWHVTRNGSHNSRLTGDGFPVEFVFSSLDTAVRYTSEVAGPGLAPGQRFGARAIFWTLGTVGSLAVDDAPGGVRRPPLGSMDRRAPHIAPSIATNSTSKCPRTSRPLHERELDDALGRIPHFA